MPTKRRRLPHTFPHKIILVASLVLCTCAGTTVIMAVIAWTNRLWGYMWMTGFWSGAVILLAGIFGIVCSFVRNTGSVKTFMIISIFGCIASLGMIALSAGGLDTNSGFYVHGNKAAYMTSILHAVNLGVGILQLALCILSDGICIYYLFVEKSAELYRVKSGRKTDKTKPIVRGQSVRDSSGSQVPLMNKQDNDNKRHTKDKKRKNSKKDKTNSGTDFPDVDSTMPILYSRPRPPPLSAELLRQQDEQHAPVSPTRNQCFRSASFSTFGRGVPVPPDRVSLIVHPPDDNASLAGTTRTQTPRSEAENHYAQTLLFKPPLPIEEDDELPPYEVEDKRQYENIPNRRHRRPNSAEIHFGGNTQIQRSRSLPSRDRKLAEANRRKRALAQRAQISPGRLDNEGLDSETERKVPVNVASDQVPLRHSQSADLLSCDGDGNASSPSELVLPDAQGVMRRDFAHSSEIFLENGVRMRHSRPHSVHVGREQRLDRRRRALSAEIRLNKDQILAHRNSIQEYSELGSRTKSIDGSNSSLYASSRIMPSRFSLRTPMRKVGIPYISSPVPVKPLQASDLHYGPPPKPPRTHSVTMEDLVIDTVDYADADDVFADIKKIRSDNEVNTKDNKVINNNTQEVKAVEPVRNPNNDNKETIKSATGQLPKTPDKSANAITTLPTEKTVTLEKPHELNSPTSPVAILDSGPLLKCAPPTIRKKPARSKPIEMVKPLENKPANVMTLPTSPILKTPLKHFETPTTSKNESRMTEKDVNAKSNNMFLNSSLSSTKKADKTENQVTPQDGVVVYAKIDKSEATSPGMKVQRARKLLYSFSDKDEVNVFDPSPLEENKPFSEQEAIVEVAERVNVTQTENKPHQKTNHQEKSVGMLVQRAEPIVLAESLKVTPVKAQPLSTSERILLRKNLNTSIDVVHDPNNNSSREQNTGTSSVPIDHAVKDIHYGARPKTTVRTEPSQSKHTDSTALENIQTPSKGKAPDPPRSLLTVISTKPQVFAKPNRPIPPTRTSSSSTAPAIPLKPLSTKQPSRQSFNSYLSSKDESPRVQRYSLRGTAPTSSSNSPSLRSRIAPESQVARSAPQVPMQGASSNSQGVLHLPQSQHSRQVPDQNAQHGVHNINPNVALPQVGNNLQANNNDPHPPLYSQFL